METAKDGLMPQDLNQLDIESLTPLSPEVISRQATINVGTLGHVSHGKSTVVRGLSGKDPVRFRQERERNVTIKLGYANAKIYKCDNPDLELPRYTSFSSDQPDVIPCESGGNWRLQRHISLVDCPGHDVHMATMLNGAAVMDAALLLIAGNEPCPQPQTCEHLAVVEIMRLKHLLILQNKVELLKPPQAQAQQEEIRRFVAGTGAEGAPIVPTCAVLKVNLDKVCEYLCTHVPVPLRDFTSPPLLSVVRSFDVNRPGAGVEDLHGGVVGGSLFRGVLKVGDKVEIRPGVVERDFNGGFLVQPIRTTVESLSAEQNVLQFAVPGGLIGVGTGLDPAQTRGDRLVGNVLGQPEHLPEIYLDLEIKYYLLNQLLGVKPAEGEARAPVSRLKVGEILMLSVGSATVGARVAVLKEGDVARLRLTSPVCSHQLDRVAISRRVDKHWRLIGWGEIARGALAKNVRPIS